MKRLASTLIVLGLVALCLGLVWSQPLACRVGATAMVLGAVVGQAPARKAKAPLTEEDRLRKEIVADIERRYGPGAWIPSRPGPAPVPSEVVQPPEPQAVS